MGKKKRAPVDPVFASMKSWPNFLQQIRTRPGCYLGEFSLTALQHQIYGVMLAEDIHAIPKSKPIGGFAWERFEDWVRKRFNPRHLSVRSFWLALDSTETEKEAFQRWFEWYDQFNQEHPNE